jgi:hypothetical protein
MILENTYHLLRENPQATTLDQVLAQIKTDEALSDAQAGGCRHFRKEGGFRSSYLSHMI